MYPTFQQTFVQQSLAAIVLLILYTKCIATKQKFAKMLYIYFVKIWYTSVVAIHLVPNFCIQNVYTVSVVWPSHATQDVFSWCGQ